MKEFGRSLHHDLLSTELANLTLAEMREGQTYEQVTIAESEQLHSQLRGLGFERAIFNKVNLSASKWPSLDLFEVVMESCTFANADWQAGRFEHVELRRSRMTGVSLATGEFDNVVFDRCKLDLSILHDAHLASCCFERCDLREADFQGASLRRVKFRECALRSARFPGAVFEHVDLRGSQVAGIHIDNSALRGTPVDPAQVADLAALLGLIVRPVNKHDD